MTLRLSNAWVRSFILPNISQMIVRWHFSRRLALRTVIRPSFERQTKGVTESDRMRDLFPDQDISPVVHKHSRKDSKLNGGLSSAPAI